MVSEARDLLVRHFGNSVDVVRGESQMRSTKRKSYAIMVIQDGIVGDLLFESRWHLINHLYALKFG